MPCAGASSIWLLLPIENTSAGSMNETYDLLAEGGSRSSESN